MLERLKAMRASPLAFDYHGQAVLGSAGLAGFAACDDTFGPFAAGCRNGRLDFTLLFEQTIFAIVPSALFILAAIAAIFQLWGQKPKVYTTLRYHVKMVSLHCLPQFSAAHTNFHHLFRSYQLL